MKVPTWFAAIALFGPLLSYGHGTAAFAQGAAQESQAAVAEQRDKPTPAEGAQSPESLESPEKVKASSLGTETDLYRTIRLHLDQYRKPAARES